MIIDMQIDLTIPDKLPRKDGQIAVKVPKDFEERFKILNIKHKYVLNEYMRLFAFKLIDEVEKRDSA